MAQGFAGAGQTITFNYSGAGWALGTDTDNIYNTNSKDVLVTGDPTAPGTGRLQVQGRTGANIITNGTFTGNSTGWTEGTGWSYGTNNEVHADGETDPLTKPSAIPHHGRYKISIDIDATGNKADLFIRTNALDNGDVDGRITILSASETGYGVFSAFQNTDGDLLIYPNTEFDGTIDNVVVTELLPMQTFFREDAVELLRITDWSDIDIETGDYRENAVALQGATVAAATGTSIHLRAGHSLDKGFNGGDLVLVPGMGGNAGLLKLVNVASNNENSYLGIDLTNLGNQNFAQFSDMGGTILIVGDPQSSPPAATHYVETRINGGTYYIPVSNTI